MNYKLYNPNFSSWVFFLPREGIQVIHILYNPVFLSMKIEIIIVMYPSLLEVYVNQECVLFFFFFLIKVIMIRVPRNSDSGE